MTEVISQDTYSAMKARAEVNPNNADYVTLYRAAGLMIENGKLRLVE